MKKLFILILFGLYLAGCDDDNNEPLEFRIVTRMLIFRPAEVKNDQSFSF
jgi:hypothetical protein